MERTRVDTAWPAIPIADVEAVVLIGHLSR
jgi:hypothetical protein